MEQVRETCILLAEPHTDSPSVEPEVLPLSAYIKSLLQLAWPISITSLTWPIHSLIGLYFVGRLDSVKYVDAVSLGVSWSGIFAFSIQMGLAGALDTLVSQSFGKKEFAACGLFLNRALLIISLATCVCCAAMCLSGLVFSTFGIDPDVVACAQNYTLGMIPGVILNVPWVLLERFLVLQGIVHPQMIIQVINTALYPVYCYVAFTLLDMSYMGAVAAKVFSEVIYVAVLATYIRLSECCSQCFVPLDKSALTGWREYLSLGVPTLLMTCLEWWAWEILNLVCGTLGVAELAANSTVYNIGIFLFIFSAGLSGASSTLVGKSLGEGNARVAKTYATIGTFMTIIGTSMTCLVMLSARSFFESFFTDDPSVIGILDGLMYLFLFQAMFDNTQMVLGRIIIATGYQGNASFANLVCYYTIMLPVAFVAGILGKLGVFGIWMGCTAGSIGIFGWYAKILYKLDWDSVVTESHKRIEEGKNAGS